MKRNLMIGALALGLSSACFAQVIPGRYIAVFKDDVQHPAVAAQALAAQHGVGVGYVYQHGLKGFAFGGSAQAAAALARRAEVAYVEQDQLFHAIGSTLPLPTGIDRVDVDAALAIPTLSGSSVSLKDADVTVAVLDTGADSTHPDLNIIGGIRFYTRGLRVVSDGNYADGNGHGTHVSGTIGAKDDGVNTTLGDHVVGVAPDVKIYAVKVLADNGSGSVSAIAAGMEHILTVPGIRVANMSLGGGVSQVMDLAIKTGTDAGIVYVVAAGNSSADVSTTSPARAPSAITVSALADSDGAPGGLGLDFYYSDGTFATADDTFAPFSNYGEGVDICAPGVMILSTVPGGGYSDAYSGTSMAAPHVAGAAALYIANNLTKTVDEVTQALLSSGWKADEDGYILGGDPDKYREPVLNVGRLMGSVQPVDRPPTVEIISISPLDGDTVKGGVTITATAFDDIGVTGVEFLVDGILIPGDVTSQLGAWSIYWDSTLVSDGGYEITAIATDTIGQEATSFPVNVTVNNVGDPITYVHCGDLDGSATTSRNSWMATVTATIHDAVHELVAGATVTGSWSGAYTGSAVGTTLANGTVQFTTPSINAKKTSVTFTVTGVSVTGLDYQPGANEDPDGDSNGTTITVVKP